MELLPALFLAQPAHQDSHFLGDTPAKPPLTLSPKKLLSPRLISRSMYLDALRHPAGTLANHAFKEGFERTPVTRLLGPKIRVDENHSRAAAE